MVVQHLPNVEQVRIDQPVQRILQRRENLQHAAAEARIPLRLDLHIRERELVVDVPLRPTLHERREVLIHSEHPLLGIPTLAKSPQLRDQVHNELKHLIHVRRFVVQVGRERRGVRPRRHFCRRQLFHPVAELRVRFRSHRQLININILSVFLPDNQLVPREGREHRHKLPFLEAVPRIARVREHPARMHVEQRVSLVALDNSCRFSLDNLPGWDHAKVFLLLFHDL